MKIKDRPKIERPREKLEKYGPGKLKDSELLAVLLRTGTKELGVMKLSLGIVSGFRSYESYGEGVNIQITNPISGGNSGGAVLNEYGEIIGVPTWSVEYDENIIQVQNLNFAVPINEALGALNKN